MMLWGGLCTPLPRGRPASPLRCVLTASGASLCARRAGRGTSGPAEEWTVRDEHPCPGVALSLGRGRPRAQGGPGSGPTDSRSDARGQRSKSEKR